MGVTPNVGPMDGGTRITIMGNNMDAGTTISVMIGNDMPCINVTRLDMCCDVCVGL